MLSTAAQLPAVQAMLATAQRVLGYDLLEVCTKGEARRARARVCVRTIQSWQSLKVFGAQWPWLLLVDADDVKAAAAYCRMASLVGNLYRPAPRPSPPSQQAQTLAASFACDHIQGRGHLHQ